MRDFYRTYENQPVLLPRAMKLRWIQNVMIMEAELTIELKIAFLSSISVVREWYMKAVEQFCWSKMELIENIKNEVHKGIVLDIGQNLCDNKVDQSDGSNFGEAEDIVVNILGVYVFQLIRKRILLFRCRGKPEKLCYVLCQR